ncbi:nucleoside hydrolase [Nitriliruptoraceae bacterium ZYF776]|nr:nucleoside hydrolase [Profundirhabdus halotolerans]
MTVPPTPVVLDTDLGSDVDDAQALLQVLASPELELVGVTASYGDTMLRAHLARQLLDWCGADDVPVGAGPNATRSGREVWYAGHEAGQLRPGPAAAFAPEDATALLSRLAAAHRGRLVVLGIAPLNTLATALVADPTLSGQLAALHLMGGRFGDGPRPEHNIVCDVDAAEVVFGAEVPTTVIGVETTTRVRIPEDRFDELTVAGDPAARWLAEVLAEWTDFTGEPWSIPHDPLAVATLTHPELFTTVEGAVTVTPDGRTVHAAGAGVHRVTDLDVDALTELVITRIASRRGRP